MRTSDQVTIEIDEAERAEMIVVIGTPVGSMRVMGEVDLLNGVLIIDRALTSTVSNPEAGPDRV